MVEKAYNDMFSSCSFVLLPFVFNNIYLYMFNKMSIMSLSPFGDHIWSVYVCYVKKKIIKTLCFLCEVRETL